jgi:hypothetical protein
MHQTLGDELSYYWTLWQNEWATDYIFDSPGILQQIMSNLLRHAHMTGTSTRVLRYMGHPVSADGQPHWLAKPELLTRVQQWYDGMRIRHWVDQNSVKLYNEQNVLRVETTINNPGRFRVYRHTEGQEKTESKKLVPLRKGIADIPLRAQVAADINHRFSEQMATMTNETPVCDVLKKVVNNQEPKFRDLDIIGKDRELLQGISDSIYVVSGITNKLLQQKLEGTLWAKGKTGKQLSARISRHLRLLRHHGIIKKMSKQNKYYLTDYGRLLTTSLNAILAASTQQLMEKAA